MESSIVLGGTAYSVTDGSVLTDNKWSTAIVSIQDPTLQVTGVFVSQPHPGVIGRIRFFHLPNGRANLNWEEHSNRYHLLYLVVHRVNPYFDQFIAEIAVDQEDYRTTRAMYRYCISNTIELFLQRVTT